MRLSSVRTFGLLVVIAGLVLAPVSQARRAESLALNVAFFANGTITVTLPDGTSLGTTSGTAQMIPAGYYTLLFSGPGGCSALPYFHLNGPGIDIATDMNEGTQSKAANGANLEPSSTYTWSDDAFPDVTHTFTTSAVVEGSPPSPSSNSTSGSSSGPGVSYPSIIGSETASSRGTLKATLGSKGAFVVTYKGKQASTLPAGKYKISVKASNASAGLTLKRPGHASLLIARLGFTGAHTTTVSLTRGTWFFAAAKGGTRLTVVVH